MTNDPLKLPFALIWLLAILTISSPVRSQTSATLTTDQAISLALTNNRELQATALEITKAQNERNIQKTQLLPSSTVKIAADDSLQNPSLIVPAGSFDGFPPANATIAFPPGLIAYLQADLQQPITQVPRIKMAIEATDAAVLIAVENLRLQRQSLLVNVKTTCYTILRNVHAEQVDGEELKFLRELQRTVTDRVADGAELKSDLLDVKARVVGLEHTMLSDHNSILTSKDQLNLLLGRDLDTAIDLVDPTNPPELSTENLEPLLERAIKQRPEVRQAVLRSRQAVLEERIQARSTGPDLGFEFQYLLPTGGVLADQLISFGVLMSWKPLDWGSRHQLLEEKRHTVEQSKAHLGYVEDRVRQEVRDGVRRLDEARDLVRVVTLQQDAAAEKARVMRNRYHLSLSLLKDVLEAESSLKDARRQFQDTLLAVASQEASLQKSLGEDH